jgi:hypothetical protein
MLKIPSSPIDALIYASDHGLSHPVESPGAVTIGLAGNKISLVKCLLIYRWRKISFFYGAKNRSGPGSPHCWGFTITLRHITLDRYPLDEWSAWSRNLYLITHNTHKRHNSTSPAGIETVIRASERPRPHCHCYQLGAEDSRIFKCPHR